MRWLPGAKPWGTVAVKNAHRSWPATPDGKQPLSVTGSERPSRTAVGGWPETTWMGGDCRSGMAPRGDTPTTSSKGASATDRSPGVVNDTGPPSTMKANVLFANGSAGGGSATTTWTIPG